MAEFLTTHGIAYHIDNILKNSKSDLFIVSPYLQLSTVFLDRLKEANDKGINIIIIYREAQLDELNKLIELKRVKRFVCENLHAKCYFNDDTMIITSMNMYEFSEKKNREMGILIKKQTDTILFNEAEKEVQSIMNSAVTESIKTFPNKSENERKNKIMEHTPKYESPKPKESFLDSIINVFSGDNSTGYCIRCGEKISLDAKHPLCNKCYRKWAVHNNPTFVENFCHSCGKKIKTTYEHPQCRACWKENS